MVERRARETTPGDASPALLRGAGPQGPCADGQHATGMLIRPAQTQARGYAGTDTAAHGPQGDAMHRRGLARHRAGGSIHNLPVARRIGRVSGWAEAPAGESRPSPPGSSLTLWIAISPESWAGCSAMAGGDMPGAWCDLVCAWRSVCAHGAGGISF